VRLYSLDEQFLQVASRYERVRGTHPYADAVAESSNNSTPLDHEYLKILEARLREQQQEDAQRGVDYHLTQAGGAEEVFDHSVKALIHDFTGGLPRAINNLATACLLQATARNVQRIDEALFQQASAEFQLG